ncbi:MAG TPA: ATP-binding protein [Clostridiaceae bacterium]|nr:ATP-binding protein [Clostridiaceae bacterium]
MGEPKNNQTSHRAEKIVVATSRSQKRRHHGLGMKRVSHSIDKYDGFLNLQNEPGVFATKVSIPL